MRNFKIILQYEGTRYQGWQRQESTQNTIQGKLERLLTRLAGTEVEIQASGRTDWVLFRWMITLLGPRAGLWLAAHLKH